MICQGADEDWLRCPSVHNFIKEFNPHVQGGSYGSTNVVGVWLGKDQDNGLNLSVTSAIAGDLMGQAKELVRRVQSMPGWRDKWKMVNGSQIILSH